MDVHDLRGFLALADDLNARESERRAGVPSAERVAATARLERHFGARFLEATPGGYRLTTAGRAMAAQGPGLIAVTDEMLQCVRAARAERFPRGPLERQGAVLTAQ
jgi:DNA-binding transcriptional LysR family regulator